MKLYGYYRSSAAFRLRIALNLNWIDAGFGAFEGLLADDPRTGAFCHGEEPGLADIALVPQVVNAGRYRLDLSPYPTITRIFETCMQLDAFAAAHPERQPDHDQ